MGSSNKYRRILICVATKDQAPIVYLTKNVDGKCIHEVASEEWLENYMKTRMAPIEE